MANNWRRDGVAFQPARAPEFLACGRIVRDQEFVAAGDHFGAARDGRDDRREPTALNRSRHAPDFFASRFIERDHERAFRHGQILVANQNDQIIIQNG